MSAGNPSEAILLYLFSCLQYLRMQQEFLILLSFHQLPESAVCFYALLEKESLKNVQNITSSSIMNHLLMLDAHPH